MTQAAELGRLSHLAACVFALTAGLPCLAWAQPADLEPPALAQDATPTYPKALLEQGLRGAVLLELDLDAAGKVVAVKVVESAGPDFDAAAVEAARRLQFKPAKQRGKPVPVRIRYRTAFEPELQIERRGPAPRKGRYDRKDMEESPAGFSSLVGHVKERGTGRPVIGALVTLPDLKQEAVTDGDGRFRFGLLPAGRHALYLPGAEHKPVRESVTIAGGQTTTVDLRAERLSYHVYRATAEAPPEPGEMARRSLGVEEIQRIPGVYGDAFKVVTNLPGVARDTGGSGLIVVRGSAPLDSLVAIEGQRLPLLYHFGGVYSVINTDLLEGIDFYPGGYPVRYGRQTGGLVVARLASPRQTDAWHGYLESNLFHTGFLLKGPLSEDTYLSVAARRSYIDAVLALLPKSLLPFTLSPRYYDGQLKLDHRVDERTDLTLFLFGTDDALRLVVPDPPPAFPDARGELESSTRFLSLLGVLRHRGEGFTSRTTVAALLATADLSFAELIRAEFFAREYTFRQDFTIGEGPLQLRTGLDIFCNPFDVEVFAPPLRGVNERGQTGGQPVDRKRVFTVAQDIIVSPAAYFDAVFKLRDDLEVVPGMRLDLYRGISQGETLTPRLNVRYTVDKQWTAKAATGMTSQRPQPPEIALGNQDLLPFHAHETAAGVEYKWSDAIDFDVQGFYKGLDGVVAPAESVIPSQRFVNSGTGRVFGLELLARHRGGGKFFGWVAYTLQQATRVDRPGAARRRFGWDQTHVLTTLGNYKLANNWEVGARFRLVTGNPVTELATAVWNEQTDTYTRVRSACENCGRLPAFHQLDFRVDKKWVYDRWLLNVYLDVQNVYNRSNPEGIRYNFDTSEHTYASGLPIIPSLGVRGEF